MLSIIKQPVFKYLYLLLIAILYFALGFFYYPDKAFSPDSWAYIELAKTVFNDLPFYAVTTTRSFMYEGYSASFPLFYPSLLAVFTSVFKFSSFNGVILNVTVALLTPFIVGLWLKKVGSSFDAGFLAGLFLLLYFPYQTEVFAARSVPLAILLFTAGLYATSFVRKPSGDYSYLSIFLSGLSFGLAVLTRFDYLYVVFGAVLLLIFYYKLGVKQSILLFLSILISFSPWMVYSLSKFGVLFASDNSWVFLGVEKYFVMDLIDKNSYQVLFQDPLGWFLKIFSNIPLLFSNFLIAIIAFSAPLLLVFFFIRRTRFRQPTPVSLIIGILLLTIVQIGMLLGVGYFDHRYFSLFILMGYAVMFSLITDSISDGGKKIKLIIFLSLSFLYAVSILMNTRYTTTANYKKNVSLNMLVEEISHCSDALGAQFHFFNDDTFAAKFGASTSKLTIMIPSNWNDLTEIDQKHFNEKYPFSLYVDVNDYKGECSLQSVPKGVKK